MLVELNQSYQLVGERSTPFGGLSSAKITVATIHARGVSLPVVLKTGPQVGDKEVAGHKLLYGHLPLPLMTQVDPHTVAIALLSGVDLHTAVVGAMHNSIEKAKKFARINREMWEHTQRVVSPGSLDGYPNKTGQTTEILMGQNITDVNGNAIKVSNLAQYQIYVNGKPIGILNEIIDKMHELVSDSQIGCVVHGDEHFENVRLKINGRMVVIDLSNASVRSPYESIAKIALWLDATTASLTSHSINIQDTTQIAEINAEGKMEKHIHEHIEEIIKEFKPFLKTKGQKNIASAYMMTYLIRELQWLEKRNRKHMAPYLIARALSFASGLEGDNFAYPISRKI